MAYRYSRWLAATLASDIRRGILAAIMHADPTGITSADIRKTMPCTGSLGPYITDFAAHGIIVKSRPVFDGHRKRCNCWIINPLIIPEIEQALSAAELDGSTGK